MLRSMAFPVHERFCSMCADSLQDNQCVPAIHPNHSVVKLLCIFIHIFTVSDHVGLSRHVLHMMCNLQLQFHRMPSTPAHRHTIIISSALGFCSALDALLTFCLNTISELHGIASWVRCAGSPCHHMFSATDQKLLLWIEKAEIPIQMIDCTMHSNPAVQITLDQRS